MNPFQAGTILRQIESKSKKSQQDIKDFRNALGFVFSTRPPPIQPTQTEEVSSGD